MIEREWRGFWIQGGSDPAPCLRRTFELDKIPTAANVFLCGIGWHELCINGQKADDRVLTPTVSQFDKHVSYLEYDVTTLLKKGKNVITVLLGNGWYNCRTEEVWNFCHAAWLDVPKMICDVVCDGETVAFSDQAWKVGKSPIIFNQLRNGEFYDARLETDGIYMPEFDDSSWANAVYCNPPGGIIVKDTASPCRICEKIAGKPFQFRKNAVIYDFGKNLTGWCEIALSAPAGSTVTLIYSERILDNGDITRENISEYIRSGQCQTDRYTCKGSGVEVWHPRFTYHGFRYCKVTWENADVEVHSFTAHFIHSDFERCGGFTCSDATVNRLQEMTVQSFLSNYTGIPTDCPHREKNGWTGDAQLAVECGLWNFACADSAAYFTQILADNQRPSGQLPGIVPCAGWGYNWGSGPAWDIYLFEAPRRIGIFTGDNSVFRRFLPEMKKYIRYCQSMMHEHLVDFGLGDWVEVEIFNRTPVELTSSAYFFYAVKLVAEIEPEYAQLAEKIRQAINRKFYRGNGIYANGSRTALACALYFDIAEVSEREIIAQRLAEAVRKENYKTGFGILGAKYIYRSLARYGYINEAFELLRSQEFPGYGYWVKRGETTLPENWNSSSSLNHIMFGDISAFMYEYLAGIKPSVAYPGFSHFELSPQFPDGLDAVKAYHKTSHGNIRSEWIRNGKEILCKFEIPADCTADIALPGINIQNISGCREFTVKTV